MRLSGIRALALLSLFSLLGPALWSQTAASPLQGGSWTWDGRRIEIGREEISRHVETLRRLAPAQAPADRLRAAWSRAVRVETARALGLGTDKEGFIRWMADAHSGEQRRLLRGGRPDRKALETYARERGFSSLAAYEDFCRDEYRGRCLIDQIRPALPITEAEVRTRFEAMATEMLLDVIAVAPETLDSDLVPDPADPKAREAYRNWYRLVPDRMKITYDDREHPALEAEAMYVNLRGRSLEDLRAWFDRKRPELKGESIADRTRDLKPTPHDEARIYRRWVEHRRRNLSYLNAALPSGLSDQDSFARVRDFLVLNWKVVRYLERAWKDIRARGEKISLADEARRWGLDYRHLPMQVRSSFDNDPILPGDHSQPLLKATEPGAILDYNTNFDPEKVGPYFAEGVVDQPGLHVSIYRLIRKESMRVRAAEEVRERAWPDFVRYGRWQAAQQTSRRLAAAWRNLLEETIKAAPAGSEADAIRAEAFGRFAAGSTQTRLVERLHVRPFGDRRPRARRDADLGRRLQSFIEWRWRDLAKAGAEKAWRPGQVLDFAIGLDYRVAALARIRVVKRPDARRWERDRNLRRRARAAVREDRDRRRIQTGNELFALEKLRREHDLKAPDLDALDEAK